MIKKAHIIAAYVHTAHRTFDHRVILMRQRLDTIQHQARHHRSLHPHPDRHRLKHAQNRARRRDADAAVAVCCRRQQQLGQAHASAAVVSEQEQSKRANRVAARQR